MLMPRPTDFILYGHYPDKGKRLRDCLQISLSKVFHWFIIMHGYLETVLRLKKYTIGDFCFFLVYKVWTIHFHLI